MVQFCGLQCLSCRQDPRLQLCVGHVTNNTHRHRADDRGAVINCNTGSEQIGLGDEGSNHLQVGLPERSVQRVADAWYDTLVQANGRPACGLRCEPQQGYPGTHATTETFPPGSADSVCLSPFSRRRCSGAREPCHPPLDVLSTIHPAIVASLPEPGVTRRPQSRAHRSAASRQMDRNALA